MLPKELQQPPPREIPYKNEYLKKHYINFFAFFIVVPAIFIGIPVFVVSIPFLQNSLGKIPLWQAVIFGSFLCCCWLAYAVWAVLNYSYKLKFLRNGIETKGSVEYAGTVENTGVKDLGTVVEVRSSYLDDAGNKYEVKNLYYTRAYESNYKEGDSFPVFYLPEKPEHFAVYLHGMKFTTGVSSSKQKHY